MPPSPEQHAEVAQVAAAMARAPHGAKARIEAEAAARLGVSPQTLRRWMAAHRPRRRVRRDSVERQIQRDPEAVTATLTRDEAMTIAAVLTEGGKANGKQLTSIKEAVRTLRDQGLVLAGDVNRETGEIKFLSLSAISRGLMRWKCHPAQLNQPAPHQPQRSLHPNHRWEIDASVCVVYYLPGGGAVIQEIDPTVHYKNRPANLEAIAEHRVIRYVCVCHTTGVRRWLYYPHAESAMHTVAFLAWLVAPKDDPADPFHGAPKTVVVDPGATKAGMVRRWCDLLGIRLIVTRPKNPRAKGSVEESQDFIERVFEHGLQFQKHRVRDFESLNALARTVQIHLNSTHVHSRHGMTPFEAWSRIRPEQLRVTESESVLRSLAAESPATPKVAGDLTVAYRGARWDVRHVPGANVGARIEVLYSPLAGADGRGHAVALIYDPETGAPIYRPLPRIAENEWGFRADAASDEEFKSMPDTEVDRVRKALALSASGSETQAEDAAKRRSKAFRPLAHLDDGRGVDPYRAAETAEPVTWMPKRGTEHRVTAPTVEPLLLDHVEAALRLAPMVRARGGTWGPEQFDWIVRRYPAGVPEDALAAVADAIVGRGETSRSDGLRVIK